MHIAYICSDFGIPIHGHKGASIHVRELTRALSRLGHQVVIFSPRRGGPAPVGFDVDVVEVDLEPPEKRVYELLSDDPGVDRAAAREIRSLLYAATLRQRLRDHLADFQPDVIYERYSLLGSGGLAAARERGVPLLIEVNAPLTGEQEAHRGLALGQTARAVERTVLGAADHVLAVSRPLAAWLAEIGVSPERVIILANGVDADRFASGAAARDAVRAGLGIAHHEPVVGFVGTLKPWHGTATLVRAVATLRRRGLVARLLLVGDGPEREHLVSLAANEGIADATIFVGSVPHEQIPGLLAAMDVATAPYDRSDDFYFSPLKLFEAMAAGRPVVAAAIGQIAEVVRDGETGLLYPPGQLGRLAKAIAGLIADPRRAAAIGLAAQAEVRAGRTWERNARTVTDLIDRLAGTPRVDGPSPRAAPPISATATR